ncbi:RluA family pseudouridine synthase [Clostridium hydrogenum]|uniref:RluA family pseudouridine synthase n=1 Tax=Clostridium hydrogenum TaxID=2855764 RepID=UPI001F19A6D7|nr:RluA family pseudouridine synthase [Clostridium hydrogenum]
MNNSKLSYNVEKQYEGLKIKEYLKDVQGFSTRFIRGTAHSGRIFVNGKVVKLSHVLKFGQKIEVQVTKSESQNVEPEEMDIDVVYEDEDIIVVNKRPGMVVHPTKSYQQGTLSNGLIYYFREKGEDCIVRLVNRLDMDTSGLVLVAKNQFSHMALARDMNLETFKKEYLAIAHGHINPVKGTIDKPIYREEGGPLKRIVDERGQKSITNYEVIESYKDGELIKLSLETGRTHQIRVHLSSVGNPIYGDSLYGKEEEEYIGRQALHAYKLQFPHPRDGRIISLETELPEDMKKLINKLIQNKS